MEGRKKGKGKGRGGGRGKKERGKEGRTYCLLVSWLRDQRDRPISIEE